MRQHPADADCRRRRKVSCPARPPPLPLAHAWGPEPGCVAFHALQASSAPTLTTLSRCARHHHHRGLVAAAVRARCKQTGTRQPPTSAAGVACQYSAGEEGRRREGRSYTARYTPMGFPHPGRRRFIPPGPTPRACHVVHPPGVPVQPRGAPHSAFRFSHAVQQRTLAWPTPRTFCARWPLPASSSPQRSLLRTSEEPFAPHALLRHTSASPPPRPPCHASADDRNLQDQRQRSLHRRQPLACAGEWEEEEGAGWGPEASPCMGGWEQGRTGGGGAWLVFGPLPPTDPCLQGAAPQPRTAPCRDPPPPCLLQATPSASHALSFSPPSTRPTRPPTPHRPPYPARPPTPPACLPPQLIFCGTGETSCSDAVFPKFATVTKKCGGQAALTGGDSSCIPDPAGEPPPRARNPCCP